MQWMDECNGLTDGDSKMCRERGRGKRWGFKVEHPWANGRHSLITLFNCSVLSVVAETSRLAFSLCVYQLSIRIEWKTVAFCYFIIQALMFS